MSTIWTPHLTVAAIIEQDGRFLMVEEQPHGETVYNQPAGHVEEGEGIVDAAVREVLEETGREFTPQAIGGLYRWASPKNGVTYLRVTVIGTVSEPLPDAQLDPDISATHWFDLDTLRYKIHSLRSPMVMLGIEEYLHGQRYPLDLIRELA